MEVRIPARQWKMIAAWLEEAYPNEGCGLLGGRRLARTDAREPLGENAAQSANEARDEGADFFADCFALEVEEAFAAVNTWPGESPQASPFNRFRIAPSFHRRVHAQLQERGLVILGVFHSHPDAKPRPSAGDRRLAWPELAYCIVEVAQGRIGEAAVWLPPELKRQASLRIID